MTTWPMVQLRRVARFAYGESLADIERTEGCVPVYGSNGQVGLHDRPNTAAPVIVIGRKGSFGKVQFSSCPVFAIDTTFFVDPTQSSVDLRWLYYVLGTLHLDSLSEDVGVPGLSRERAYAARLPLPPPHAQCAIADYLDGETARIDALIEKRQRLGALLQERRQALISQAVLGNRVPGAATRGDHVMASITLRRVARLQRGAGFPHEYQGSASGDLPFFKVADFGLPGNERYLQECTNWVSHDVASALRAVPVPPASVLLPKIGAALLGNARRITTRPSVFDNNVLAVVPHSIEERYLHYWLSTIDLAELANPGPVPSLIDDSILNLRIPVTSGEIQSAIADYLDAETARIDGLIERIESQMRLLQEHRQALITAAVTGELEVPGVAA